MDQAAITQNLKDYLIRLSKFVSIDEALLFGSFSTGKALEDSDVDLLILSRDFSKYDPDTRQKIIYRASTGFPYDLHAYGVTPEEYISASPLTTLGAIRSANPPAISKSFLCPHPDLHHIKNYLLFYLVNTIPAK